MLRSVTAGLVLALAGSRANAARTVLSWAGIVIGIGALITVVTVSDTVERYVTARSEATAGRAATFRVDLAEPPEDPAAFETDLRRAGATEVSLTAPVNALLVRGASPVPDTAVELVDASLDGVRRMPPVRGRWFTEDDQRSLTPVLVVNEALAASLGDLTDVQIGARRWLDARVVGVVETGAFEHRPRAYLLRSPSIEELMPAAAPSALTYSILLPPDDAVPERFLDRLGLVFWRWGPEGADVREYVSVRRVDGAEAVRETIDRLSLGLLGIACVTLATGLLGMLNVGLATIRERRRELATYRALGADSLTLFTAVAAESVVVSALAGAVALALCLLGARGADAVLSPRLPPDVSVFVPFDAALAGLAGAALVGLLAGIVPAWRALRAPVASGLRE